MKTKDLIKLPEKNGWRFIRHGANHDYTEMEMEWNQCRGLPR